MSSWCATRSRVPPDKSREDVDKANDAEFRTPEDSAAYAALGYLRYPRRR